MLGDYKVVDEDDDTYKVLKNFDFQMPQVLYLTNERQSMAYDQIAFAPIPEYTEMTDEEKSHYYQSYWRTFQRSDHFPLWVELEIDFSDEYLENAKTELENGIFANLVVDS